MYYIVCITVVIQAEITKKYLQNLPTTQKTIKALYFTHS